MTFSMSSDRGHCQCQGRTLSNGSYTGQSSVAGAVISSMAMLLFDEADDP